MVLGLNLWDAFSQKASSASNHCAISLAPQILCWSWSWSDLDVKDRSCLPLPGSYISMTQSKLFISLLMFWCLICEIWMVTAAYHEDDMNASHSACHLLHGNHPLMLVWDSGRRTAEFNQWKRTIILRFGNGIWLWFLKGFFFCQCWGCSLVGWGA